MDPARRRAKLQELHDLALGSQEFEGGTTFEDDMEALIVGDWAIFAVDDMGDLALSFHLDAHPLAVARLTRFLMEHEVPFVLHEAFTVDEEDRIVFESDIGADLEDGRPDGAAELGGATLPGPHLGRVRITVGAGRGEPGASRTPVLATRDPRHSCTEISRAGTSTPEAWVQGGPRLPPPGAPALPVR